MRDMASVPFKVFSEQCRDQSPLREAITSAYRRAETECLPPLIAAATLPAAAQAEAQALARRLVETLRAKGPGGGVEGLIHEYALSSQEGVALMCLAEALLRIPDDATRDALIRHKIGGGDWEASRPKPVAVRQCRDLGPAADRQARRHQQRANPVGGAHAPDRPRRRAADPPRCQ